MISNLKVKHWTFKENSWWRKRKKKKKVDGEKEKKQNKNAKHPENTTNLGKHIAESKDNQEEKKKKDSSH